MCSYQGEYPDMDIQSLLRRLVTSGASHVPSADVPADTRTQPHPAVSAMVPHHGGALAATGPRPAHALATLPQATRVPAAMVVVTPVAPDGIDLLDHGDTDGRGDPPLAVDLDEAEAFVRLYHDEHPQAG